MSPHPSHSVENSEILSHTFSQKFRESNGLTKEITKELIWRNFFSVINFLRQFDEYFTIFH